MAGSFACKYLIMPIFQGTGYNPVNTVVLAGLFYLLALFSYSCLKSVIRLKSVDYFAWAAAPYIVLGGIMRSLTDAGVYPGIAWPAGLCGSTVNLSKALFVTPGAYLLPLSILFVALFTETRLRHTGKIAVNLGWLLVAANLFLLKSVRTEVILGTLAVSVVVFAIATLLYKILRLKFMEDLYGRLALAAQLFEASATFIGISFYRYSEQHVIASLAIGGLGPASVFLVKMAVVPFVLWACSDLDTETAKYVKVLIIALGLGPGLRDMLSVAMGV